MSSVQIREELKPISSSMQTDQGQRTSLASKIAKDSVIKRLDLFNCLISLIV